MHLLLTYSELFRNCVDWFCCMLIIIQSCWYWICVYYISSNFNVYWIIQVLLCHLLLYSLYFNVFSCAKLSSICAFIAYVLIIIITTIMLIVQYPVQFSRLPRNIDNPCLAALCAGELWFNYNTAKVHAFHALLIYNYLWCLWH